LNDDVEDDAILRMEGNSSALIGLLGRQDANRQDL